MAVGYVEPIGVAADLDVLAADLAGEANISAAVEVVDVPEVMDGRKSVKVTGTAGVDITNAITAVGNCQVKAGTVIV